MVKTAGASKNIGEAILNNADDAIRLAKKDADANSMMGRIGGFFRGKSKDRYKRALDNNGQQAKDLRAGEAEINTANKEVNTEKAKRTGAYVASGLALAGSAGAATYVHQKNKAIDKTRGNITKQIHRFNTSQRRNNQMLNNTAKKITPRIEKTAGIDKEAGNALQKFLKKKWDGGDVDGATNAMRRVSEHTRKAGQKSATKETLERQSHGLAQMGQKGGMRNPNFANTYGDGKVGRRLMKSNDAPAARYIGKNGKKVNLSAEGLANANKIKPGAISRKPTSRSIYQNKVNQIGLTKKLEIPRNTLSPANNTSGSLLSKQN